MTKLEELKTAFEAVIADGDLKVDHWDDNAGATLYFGTPDRDGDLPYDQMLLEQDNDNVFAPADELMDFIALAHNLMPTLLEAVELLETVSSARACQDHEFDTDAWFRQVRRILKDLK